VPGSAATTTGIDEHMGRTDDIRAVVIDDLTFDPDVDASGITVEDRDGEVVLAGSVPSYRSGLCGGKRPDGSRQIT
jgi:osmotically-inducible protein OsmY